MAVEIGPFVRGEEAGVIDVILPIQREEFGIAVTAADQPDLAAIPDFYQAGAGGFWVARDGGEIVGTIGLKDIGDGEAALRKMFVAAPWRGREHAVAARLLKTLLDHARGAGLKTLYLGTTDRFLAAHRFYEKNGFVEVAKTSLPASFPLMAVDSRFYRIDL